MVTPNQCLLDPPMRGLNDVIYLHVPPLDGPVYCLICARFWYTMHKYSGQAVRSTFFE